MEFRILGLLEVESDGDLLPVGRRQPRALLAVLLLEANRVVPRDRLVEALWGDKPPERAANALQVYVSQLRGTLGRDLIVTQPPGYMIRVDEGRLDLEHFEQLVSEARRHEEADAALLLREALSLWRGPPLADLPDTPLFEGERRRLEELRLGALEARIDADLALGEHAALVPELETLVREHPLRERLRGQLMLALYQSGRQAEALDVFGQGRRLLADELGLEPSEALKHLQKAILDQGPELAAVAPRARARTDAARERAIPVKVAASLTGRRRLISLVTAGLLVLAAGIAAAVVESTSTAPRRASANTVDAIDASGGSVRSFTGVGTAPGNIVVGDGSVWVLNGDDRTISRIDPGTRRVVKTFALGTTPTDLAAGDGSLWVGNGATTAGQASFGYTRSVSRIDPVSTSVSTTTRLPGQPSTDIGLVAGLSGLSVAAGSAWAVDPDGSISRLDPATGRLTARFPVKAGGSIAADRRGVWFLTSLSSGEPAVDRIDSAGRVTKPIAVLASGLVDIAVGAGSVWATDPLDGTVWRIEPGPHPVTQTIQAGFGVSHIAFGDGAVWVASFLQGTVSRIDPHTNRVTTTLPVPGTPQGVAVGAGSAWVSVAGGTTPGSLSTTNCSRVESGGVKPDLLIASDLPLQGPPAARLVPAAIQTVLRLRHFTAGRYRLGYQSCDDSTGQEGAFDFFKCAANAHAYAADQNVVAVIGPYDSGCAQVEIPILDRAVGGSLPLLSPSNTLPGLTRASLMNGRDEPGRYYPSGTRNYFRLSAADDLSGAADAVLARQLRLRRVYALSDGSNYARATIARFTATAGKLHLTVVGSAAWNPSSRNDARVAATVAGTDPDGIFLAGFPLESGALIRALRARLGKRPALIGANGYLPISDLLGSAGKAALGMYVSDSISLSGAPDPAAERVLRALKNDEPTQALAGAYLPEAAQLTALILDAVAKSNGTRKSILDALARGHVSNGILGSFRFDANGDKTPATFTILRVTGRRAPGLITDFQGATVDRTVLLQPNLTGP